MVNGEAWPDRLMPNPHQSAAKKPITITPMERMADNSG
jgi:hypothetical protein